MADVFISYTRDERDRIVILADRLRTLGLDVWFDARLNPGETINDEIAREVEEAAVILVCWTPNSITSQWVNAEADIGRQRGVLVACMLEQTRLRPPFNLIHAEDLVGFDGDWNHRGFLKLVDTISNKLKRPAIKAWARLEARPSVEGFENLAVQYPDDPLAERAWERAEGIEEENLAYMREQRRKAAEKRVAKMRGGSSNAGEPVGIPELDRTAPVRRPRAAEPAADSPYAEAGVWWSDRWRGLHSAFRFQGVFLILYGLVAIAHFLASFGFAWDQVRWQVRWGGDVYLEGDWATAAWGLAVFVWLAHFIVNLVTQSTRGFVFQGLLFIAYYLCWMIVAASSATYNEFWMAAAGIGGSILFLVLLTILQKFLALHQPDPNTARARNSWVPLIGAFRLGSALLGRGALSNVSSGAAHLGPRSWAATRWLGLHGLFRVQGLFLLAYLVAAVFHAISIPIFGSPTSEWQYVEPGEIANGVPWAIIVILWVIHLTVNLLTSSFRATAFQIIIFFMYYLSVGAYTIGWGLYESGNIHDSELYLFSLAGVGMFLCLFMLAEKWLVWPNQAPAVKRARWVWIPGISTLSTAFALLSARIERPENGY